MTLHVYSLFTFMHVHVVRCTYCTVYMYYAFNTWEKEALLKNTLVATCTSRFPHKYFSIVLIAISHVHFIVDSTQAINEYYYVYKNGSTHKSLNTFFNYIYMYTVHLVAELLNPLLPYHHNISYQTLFYQNSLFCTENFICRI